MRRKLGIYLYNDRSILSPRDRYMVVSRSSEGHSDGTPHFASNVTNVTKYTPTLHLVLALSLPTPSMMKISYALKHHLHKQPRLRIIQLK